jgi:hypothetical protein
MAGRARRKEQAAGRMAAVATKGEAAAVYFSPHLIKESK